ncbi:hypothetical protein REPUB_Repub07fG0138600 [Reevesia pubescens]
MGSALETLCGQAFGSGQVNLLGVYMQRSWIILIAACLILLPFYIFATPILKLLGKEDDIADLAGKFSILTISQLFSLAISFPTVKFLQAQTKVNVLTWIRGGMGFHGWHSRRYGPLFDSLLLSCDALPRDLILLDSMNLNGWEAMLFVRINVAISVRVSNELGSGHPRATKWNKQWNV